MAEKRKGPNLIMRFDPELLAWLKDRAEEQGRTMTKTLEGIVRTAMAAKVTK